MEAANNILDLKTWLTESEAIEYLNTTKKGFEKMKARKFFTYGAHGKILRSTLDHFLIKGGRNG